MTDATKNSICRQLLPGHEDNQSPSPPRTLYSGLAALSNLYGPRGQHWTVELPPGTKLEAEAGDQVHTIIREGP